MKTNFRFPQGSFQSSRTLKDLNKRTTSLQHHQWDVPVDKEKQRSVEERECDPTKVKNPESEEELSRVSLCYVLLEAAVWQSTCLGMKPSVDL